MQAINLGWSVNPLHVLKRRYVLFHYCVYPERMKEVLHLQPQLTLRSLLTTNNSFSMPSLTQKNFPVMCLTHHQLSSYIATVASFFWSALSYRSHLTVGLYLLLSLDASLVLSSLLRKLLLNLCHPLFFLTDFLVAIILAKG